MGFARLIWLSQKRRIFFCWGTHRVHMNTALPKSGRSLNVPTVGRRWHASTMIQVQLPTPGEEKHVKNNSGICTPGNYYVLRGGHEKVIDLARKLELADVLELVDVRGCRQRRSTVCAGGIRPACSARCVTLHLPRNPQAINTLDCSTLQGERIG